VSSIDEKRVHEGTEHATEVAVATGTGLARVSVVGDRVGGIELRRRCVARDVAAAEGRLAVATDEDVLVAADESDASDAGDDRGSFESTGFGPATAVGFDGNALLAAGEGTVARHDDGDWRPVGELDGVRAIDGDLLAADAGIYRAGDRLRGVGLDAGRDVAAAGTPHAATETGLYRLGNGWLDALDGDFLAIDADPATAEPGALGRAHAATRDALFEHAGERNGRGDDGEWLPVDVPGEGSVVGIAYDTGVYAVTRGGTFLVDAGEGFRTHPLGLPDVAALAVP
jgi:hypothetical protein